MKTILFFCTLLFHSVLISQSVIKGTLTTVDLKDPLPFANVTLKQYNELIKGATTGFDGCFKIKGIPDGIYEVEFSYVGFQSKRFEIEVSGDDLILDECLLKGIAIEEVIITGCTKPLFECSEYSCSASSTQISDLEIVRCFSSCGFKISVVNNPVIQEGIEVLQLFDQQLSVFPNPSSGERLVFKYVTSDMDANYLVAIQINDMLGKLIYSDEMRLQGGRLKIESSLLQSQLPGQYFVSLVDKEKRFTKKLIIH